MDNSNVNKEEKKYETHEQSYKGASTEMKKSLCPESWRDVFVFNEPNGRIHIVPSASVGLTEVAHSQWIFRTPCGDFKPVAEDLLYRMVEDGVREFAIRATTYELELLGACSE